MAVTLLLTFVGLGLYLRGFYLYFRTVHWLRQAAQAELRRRYRSSALAAAFREPELVHIKTGLILALVGLPLFAISGAVFNFMQRS